MKTYVCAVILDDESDNEFVHKDMLRDYLNEVLPDNLNIRILNLVPEGEEGI